MPECEVLYENEQVVANCVNVLAGNMIPLLLMVTMGFASLSAYTRMTSSYWTATLLKNEITF